MWIAPAARGRARARARDSRRPEALAAATPWLVLWLVSPLVAWWLSRPLPDARRSCPDDQTAFLNDWRGKTWRFFETFVGPEDNWLPPDNFQEHPVAGDRAPHVADQHRPGAAGEPGRLRLRLQLGGRTDRPHARTFGTLDRMERYRGHFFNWYDTRTLEPLPPLYVSTVDSGNLAGHLLVLRSGSARAGRTARSCRREPSAG